MTSFLYCGGRQNTLLTTFPPRALGDVGSRNVETHILLTRSKCGWKLGNFVKNIAELSRQFAINILLGKVVKFHSNFFLLTKCLFLSMIISPSTLLLLSSSLAVRIRLHWSPEKMFYNLWPWVRKYFKQSEKTWQFAANVVQ